MRINPNNISINKVQSNINNKPNKFAAVLNSATENITKNEKIEKTQKIAGTSLPLVQPASFQLKTEPVNYSKVEIIKQKISSGNYSVDSKKVAEKIIKGIHFDQEK